MSVLAPEPAEAAAPVDAGSDVQQIREALATTCVWPPRVAAPFEDAIVAPDPQPSGFVSGDPLNHAAAFAVEREARERGAVVARQDAVFTADPQDAVAILVERREPAGLDAGRVRAREDREPDAVEPHQSVERRQPQVAVAGLQDGLHGALRQPLIRGPRVEPMLRARLGVQQERQNCQ